VEEDVYIDRFTKRVESKEHGGGWTMDMLPDMLDYRSILVMEAEKRGIEVFNSFEDADSHFEVDVQSNGYGLFIDHDKFPTEGVSSYDVYVQGIFDAMFDEYATLDKSIFSNLDDYLGKDCLLYAGFSVSNMINSFNTSYESIMKICSNGGVCVVPNVHFLRGYPLWENVRFEDGVLKQGKLTDYAFEPCDFIIKGFGVCRLSDIAFTILGIDDLLHVESPVNTAHFFNDLWMCVYDMKLIHTDNENILNSLTHRMKPFTNGLRTVTKISSRTTYITRQQVMADHGFTVVDDRLGYRVVNDTEIYPVSISGHLSGAIVRALTNVIDINAYLLHIQRNFEMDVHEPSIEGQIEGNWHSIVEWKLSVYAGVKLVKDIFGLDACDIESYVLDKLENLSLRIEDSNVPSPEALSMASKLIDLPGHTIATGAHYFEV